MIKHSCIETSISAIWQCPKLAVQCPIFRKPGGNFGSWQSGTNLDQFHQGAHVNLIWDFTTNHNVHIFRIDFPSRQLRPLSFAHFRHRSSSRVGTSLCTVSSSSSASMASMPCSAISRAAALARPRSDSTFKKQNKIKQETSRNHGKLLYFEWSPPWHVGWGLSSEGC